MMGSPILFLSFAPQRCRVSAASMKYKFTIPSCISIIYCSPDCTNNKDLALTAPFCFILRFSFLYSFHFSSLCLKALNFPKILWKFPRCRVLLWASVIPLVAMFRFLFQFHLWVTELYFFLLSPPSPHPSSAFFFPRISEKCFISLHLKMLWQSLELES